MRISIGKGKTEYGPGVDINLTGDEVAQAILDFVTKQNVVISGPLTVMVNGKLCKKGKIYVDPSGMVAVKGSSEATKVKELVEDEYVIEYTPHYPWKDWAQFETVDVDGDVGQWNKRPKFYDGIWQVDDNEEDVKSFWFGHIQKDPDFMPSIVMKTKELARKENKSRYPWRPWAQYETVNKDGTVYQWFSKPVCENGIWLNSDLNSVQYAEIAVTALPADPKTTLIKRYE